MQPFNEAPHKMVGEDHIASCFGGVFLRLTRLLDRRMARQGASLARTKVLLLTQKQGPVRATDIAEMFSLAPRTVTDTLDGMERQGLIRREPDAKDRRVKRIHLTDAGREALAATEPTRRELISQVIGTLNEAEQAEFARLLDKLDTALTKEEAAEAIG
ncbi:MAG: MarR family transcriptional regulator [Croceibacterium sp.]